MKSIQKTLAVALALSASLSIFAVPARALDYEFEGDSPGKGFYQETSLDTDYIASTGNISVGTDGTVSSETTGNVTSGPASGLLLPVGEYPEAWGSATDIAIAQNSVFVNELGPTTQTTSIYTPAYLPFSVASGALPTGYGLPSASAAGAWAANGAASPAYVSGAGNYFGVAVSASALPKLTKGGAIAKLSIPTVGLSKYVYEGTTTANMNKGIAHFACTPGWGGVVALAGHNRGNGVAHFYRLKDVKLGDVVTYETTLGKRTYVVSGVDTVASTDVSGLLQDGTDKLVMYTCKMNQPEVKLKVTASLVG